MNMDEKIEQWAHEHDVKLSIKATLALARLLGENTSSATPQFHYEEGDLVKRVIYSMYVATCQATETTPLPPGEWEASMTYPEDFIQGMTNIIKEARRLAA